MMLFSSSEILVCILKCNLWEEICGSFFQNRNQVTTQVAFCPEFPIGFPMNRGPKKLDKRRTRGLNFRSFKKSDAHI
jgi:hypothetical protein